MKRKMTTGTQTNTTTATRRSKNMNTQKTKSTTTKTTTETMKPTNKKTVSFCSDVRVRPIRHINDYNPQMVERVWYRAEELGAIKESNKEAIKIIMEGVKAVDLGDCYCSRGLECLTKAGLQRKEDNVIAAREAVFLAQQQQKSQPDAIAKAYTLVSARAKAEAYKKAIQDDTESRGIVVLGGCNIKRKRPSAISHPKSPPFRQRGSIAHPAVSTTAE